MHGQVAGDAVKVPQQVTEYDQAEFCPTLSNLTLTLYSPRMCTARLLVMLSRSLSR